MEPWMFVTPAFAQTATGGGAFDVIQFAPIILVFVIMYFLVLRPQRQRQKQHQELVKNVRRGDTIVTGGGLIGKVAKVVDDNEVLVEIADNVKVRVSRGMIAEVRSKGEPVKED
jgi:preprotein translocase subunit YajC